MILMISLPVENACFWPVPCAYSAERYEAALFSMEIPAGFKTIDSKDRYVEAVIVPESGAFPSFNVLRLPPSRTVPDSDHSFGNATIESYRSVGITNCSLQQAVKTTIGGQPGYMAVINYSRSGRQMESRVASLYLEEGDLVFTLVDLADNDAASSSLFEKILNSIALNSVSPRSPEPSARRPWLATLAALLFLLSLAFVYRLRHRQRTPTNV